MSDDGRPLQVVEDAEPERVNEASNATEEKKDGGDVASVSGSVDSSKEKSDNRDGRAVRDRTNSNDPKMIRSRVFVGHLNTEKCSRSELEDLFSPFGKVASCSLQHGYGFVQYYEEQAAKRAITELHGLQFKGMKLVVDKTAALKRMQGGKYSHVPPAVATTLCALLLRLQLLLTDIAVCTSLLLTTTCTHWLLRNAIL
jgi:RNA recognition motif-containing protein